MSEETQNRENPRKVREGLVVSTGMEKTAVVAIVDRVRHRRYNTRQYRGQKNFLFTTVKMILTLETEYAFRKLVHYLRGKDGVLLKFWSVLDDTTRITFENC